MKRMTAWICQLWLVSCAFAVENDSHQRVGMLEKVDHRWESALHMTLQPWQSTWLVSLAPQFTYEFQGSYSFSISAPFLWTAQPRLSPIRGQWGDLSLSTSWRSTSGEPRWRVAAGLIRSLSPTKGPPLDKGTGELSASLVRDPLILSLSLQGSTDLPLGYDRRPTLPWQGGVQFSIQEVLNEASVQMLSLATHWSVEGPYPLWAISVSWGFAWSQTEFSAVSSVVASPSEHWTWAGSVSRTW